jgi:hypothetical protein
MRDCIICAGPTGSREHIFPAALGGRRTNKGIYCGAHNEGFSPLAAILSNQLSVIDGLLVVRGDHSDGPHSFEIVDPVDGQKYSMSPVKPRFTTMASTSGLLPRSGSRRTTSG